MKDSQNSDGPRKDKPSGEEGRPAPQVREERKREEKFARKLGTAEKRKIHAREHKEESVWFGLGTFGLVGWSVAIPTLIGLALGIWLDSALPLGFSWTLTLLFAGIVAGCLNAWYWISRERDEIGEIRGHIEDEDSTLSSDQEDEGGPSANLSHHLDGDRDHHRHGVLRGAVDHRAGASECEASCARVGG